MKWIMKLTDREIHRQTGFDLDGQTDQSIGRYDLKTQIKREKQAGKVRIEKKKYHNVC